MSQSPNPLDLAELRRLLAEASPLPWSCDDGNVFSSPLSEERHRIVMLQIKNGADDSEHPDRPYKPHSMGYLGTFPQDTENGDANSEAVAAVMSAAPALLAMAERAEALRLLQIDDDPRGLRCLECGQWWAKDDQERHLDGCAARPFTTTEGT